MADKKGFITCTFYVQLNGGSKDLFHIDHETLERYKNLGGAGGLYGPNASPVQKLPIQAGIPKVSSKALGYPIVTQLDR